MYCVYNLLSCSTRLVINWLHRVVLIYIVGLMRTDGHELGIRAANQLETCCTLLPRGGCTDVCVKGAPFLFFFFFSFFLFLFFFFSFRGSESLDKHRVSLCIDLIIIFTDWTFCRVLEGLTPNVISVKWGTTACFRYLLLMYPGVCIDAKRITAFKSLYSTCFSTLRIRTRFYSFVQQVEGSWQEL